MLITRKFQSLQLNRSYVAIAMMVIIFGMATFYVYDIYNDSTPQKHHYQIQVNDSVTVNEKHG